MGAYDCPCGNQISDVQCPNPFAFRLISDRAWYEMDLHRADESDEGDYAPAPKEPRNELVFECQICGRLLRLVEREPGNIRIVVYGKEG